MTTAALVSESRHILAPLDPQSTDMFHGFFSSRAKEAKEPSEKSVGKKSSALFPGGIKRSALIPAMAQSNSKFLRKFDLPLP